MEERCEATSREGIGTIMYFVLRKYQGGTNEMSKNTDH